jgi:hypothetical protein
MVKITEKHMVALMAQLEQDLNFLQEMENACTEIQDPNEKLEDEVVVIVTYAKIKETRKQLEALGVRM